MKNDIVIHGFLFDPTEKRHQSLSLPVQAEILSAGIGASGDILVWARFDKNKPQMIVYNVWFVRDGEQADHVSKKDYLGSFLLRSHFYHVFVRQR